MLRQSAVLLFACAVLLPAAAAAQTFVTLYPGETGTPLQASLRSGYTPTTVMSYDRGRDSLFAFVDDGDRRIVTDVYAGRTVPIRAGFDPTQEACNGDGDNSSSSCSGALNLNTEHVYPQSKGASTGPARADLHHLVPARADANGYRSNHPYGTFSNAATSRYFRDAATVTCSTTACPPADADTYSAVSVPINGVTYFMPRASVRGDLARSVFYFYTIYRTQADAADPAFFDGMLPVLLRWHLDDPVSAAEQARSARVRHYQGKDNPFVLDTSLVRRAYDPNYGASLPVELVAFSGVADGSDVRLSWTTASETNNAGFTVEQAHAGGWRARGFVPGHGTTAEAHTYAFALARVGAGAHTFRLRQHDTDGAVAFSAPLTLHAAGAPGDGLALRVTPTPARSRATVVAAMADGAHGRVEIVDVLGRVVFEADATGGTPVAVDVEALPVGRYAVRLVVGGRTRTAPLVVVR